MPTQYAPDAVMALLNDEASGRLPEAVKRELEQLRRDGTFPPPIPSPIYRTREERQEAERLSPRLPTPEPVEPTMLQRGLGAGMATGKFLYENIAQPLWKDPLGVGLPTVASLAGPVPGAVTAGLGELTKIQARAVREGRAPRPKEVAGAGLAAVAGAIPFGLGKRLRTKLVPEISPMGRRAVGLFGEDVMPSQLARSGMNEFLESISRGNPLTRGRVERIETAQARTAQEALVAQAGAMSKKVVAPVPLRSKIDEVTEVAQLAAKKRQVSRMGVQSDLYDWVLSKHGDDVVNEYGMTLRDLIGERSDLLAAARKLGQGRAKRDIMQTTDRMQMIIRNTIGPDVPVYDLAAGLRRRVADLHENPAIQQFVKRHDNVQAVELMLDPRQMKPTLTRTGEAESAATKMLKLEQAIGPEDWNNLRTATLLEQMIRSADLDGLLDGKELNARLRQMSEPMGKLFYKSAYPDIKRIADTLEHVQASPGARIGQIFLALRLPAAAMTLGGGLVGYTLGGREGAGTGALGGAAAVVITPVVLSTIFMSPRARSLFVRGLSAPVGSSIQRRAFAQMGKALTREQLFRAASWVNEPDEIPSPPEP